jgi:hypothetical protein
VKVLVETKSKTDWIGAMQNAKVEGVTGEISFDKDGQRNPSYEMKKFVGGKIQ